MKTVTKQTHKFIEEAFSTLDSMSLIETSFHRFYRYPYHLRLRLESADECADIILRLEEIAKRNVRTEIPIAESSTSGDHKYPSYRDQIGVYPIYKDAIVLQCHRPLLMPAQIPSLLYLLKIPACSEGLDVENHGFGYHFHYGKVKSEKVVRTNLLLTFNPKDHLWQKPKKGVVTKPALYGEEHADGKTKTIDVEAIGGNKRSPIYLKCLAATENRGILNFKTPGLKAKIFHSGSVAA